tara:strand:- start:328 stop:450 length:123 start_codon:yes stop_codon:yes gene_type:complete
MLEDLEHLHTAAEAVVEKAALEEMVQVVPVVPVVQEVLIL